MYVDSRVAPTPHTDSHLLLQLSKHAILAVAKKNKSKIAN